MGDYCCHFRPALFLPQQDHGIDGKSVARGDPDSHHAHRQHGQDVEQMYELYAVVERLGDYVEGGAYHYPSGIDCRFITRKGGCGEITLPQPECDVDETDQCGYFYKRANHADECFA